MIKFLGAVGVVCGAGVILLDCVVGLPLWWTLSEGPPTIALGVAMLWLAARIGPEAGRVAAADRRQG